MFGFKNSERALYERLLAEKDRLITALADEVDWHRAQSGTFVPSHINTPDTPLTEQDEALQQLLENMQIGNPAAMHLSEDEEEVLWQMEHAGAEPTAVAAALAALDGSRELPFDPE